MTGLLFAVALFVAPLAGTIPSSATALIVVGSMVMTRVAQIEWGQPEIAIPAFLTMRANSSDLFHRQWLGFRLLLYTLLKIIRGRLREVNWMVYALKILFIARCWYLRNG